MAATPGAMTPAVWFLPQLLRAAAPARGCRSADLKRGFARMLHRSALTQPGWTG
jgi:hypothetical protein